MYSLVIALRIPPVEVGHGGAVEEAEVEVEVEVENVTNAVKLGIWPVHALRLAMEGTMPSITVDRRRLGRYFYLIPHRGLLTCFE
jgi:hypothetical protein